MVVGAPMWAHADSGGDDIISTVGASPVHCDWNWWWGWQHRVVVHQWVYHRHNNDAVISYSTGSLSACVCHWGQGRGVQVEMQGWVDTPSYAL